MKHTTTHSTAFKLAVSFLVLAASFGAASAVPKLTGVSYDPAFISAGDRVNISANLREVNYLDKTWDEDKNLEVVLKPGNKLSRDYVTIEDNRDESIGFLYPEGVWNQRFQVKTDSNAPTGMYDFELHIQYLENGEPVAISTDTGNRIKVIREFSMPVDNEGVDLSSNVINTDPRTLRPGDSYGKLQLSFTNTGNKPIEEISLRPQTPEGVTPSYSADEKFFIDRLEAGGKASRTLTVDLDEDLDAGRHLITMDAEYEDQSSNRYSEELEIPLRVEGRPDLELVETDNRMKAGTGSEIKLKVRNYGEQDAESVTARIIAEKAQPFSLEDRSSYIGEIESGETETAVMKLTADRDATLKNHQIKVQLRSNGDSEEGDHSVYSFTENTEVQITDRKQSSLIYVGVLGALLVVLAAAYRYLWKGTITAEGVTGVEG